MAQYKCTMLFRDALSYSWSETHYNLTATDLENARIDLRFLAISRAALLGAGAKIYKLRVSDDEVEGDSLVDFVNYANGGYADSDGTVTPVDQSDFSYSTQRILKNAGNLNRGSLYLSGCPDLPQATNQANITDARWLDAWSTYENILLSGKWGMRCKEKDNAANPSKNILDIDSGALTFTVTAHGWTSGTQVDVRAIRSEGTPPRGTYQIRMVDANKIQPIGWTPDPEFSYLGGGTVRRVVYVLKAYSELTLAGWSPHRRGNSYLRKVGKSKTRVCA